MPAFISILAPFIINAYFHGLPFLNHNIKETVKSRNQWALILSIGVGVSIALLTKNTYLGLGIVLLGFLLWWLNGS